MTTASNEMSYAEFRNYTRMFQTFDYDKNNYIDNEELTAISKALGFKLSEMEINRIIGIYAGDQGLDFNQFLSVVIELKALNAGLPFEEIACAHIEVATKTDRLTPDSLGRWMLDSILYVITAYYCIRVPVLDVRDIELWIEGEWVLSFILMADVLLNFLTLQRNQYGEEVNDYAGIAREYAKSWCMVDVLSSLPLDLIAYHSSSSGGKTTLSYLVLVHLRLLRLLKLPVLFRTSKRGSNKPTLIMFQVRIAPVARLLFYLSLVIHIYTVIWMSLSPQATYIESIYLVLYTITTVGLGDVPVTTNAQRIFNCVLFVSGAVVNGFVISKLSQILQKASVQEEKDEKLTSMVSLLRYFQIPEGIQEEILAFQHHQLENDLSTSFKACIESLPPVLQDQLSIYAKLEHVSRLPMCKDAHIECRTALARSLTQAVFSPQEFIICAGEKGREMYFLTHGFADVMSPEGVFIITLKSGSFFGEYALLDDQPRRASVMALCYCDTLCLDRESFLEILSRYPNFRKTVMSLVEAKHVTSGNNKSAPIRRDSFFNKSVAAPHPMFESSNQSSELDEPSSSSRHYDSSHPLIEVIPAPATPPMITNPLSIEAPMEESTEDAMAALMSKASPSSDAPLTPPPPPEHPIDPAIDIALNVDTLYGPQVPSPTASSITDLPSPKKVSLSEVDHRRSMSLGYNPQQAPRPGGLRRKAHSGVVAGGVDIDNDNRRRFSAVNPGEASHNSNNSSTNSKAPPPPLTVSVSTDLPLVSMVPQAIDSPRALRRSTHNSKFSFRPGMFQPAASGLGSFKAFQSASVEKLEERLVHVTRDIKTLHRVTTEEFATLRTLVLEINRGMGGNETLSPNATSTAHLSLSGLGIIPKK
eukprot:PhF_6_TR2318/c0_g1_i2/m.4101/K04910/KCNH7; potassium voltage-gated channel Eag-related subfamily H member 7